MMVLSRGISGAEVLLTRSSVPRIQEAPTKASSTRQRSLGKTSEQHRTQRRGWNFQRQVRPPAHPGAKELLPLFPLVQLSQIVLAASFSSCDSLDFAESYRIRCGVSSGKAAGHKLINTKNAIHSSPISRPQGGHRLAPSLCLVWADVQTAEADSPILTKFRGPPGSAEGSCICVVQVEPGYRPERPKYRPLRAGPACSSGGGITQVKLTQPRSGP